MQTKKMLTQGHDHSGKVTVRLEEGMSPLRPAMQKELLQWPTPRHKKN